MFWNRLRKARVHRAPRKATVPTRCRPNLHALEERTLLSPTTFYVDDTHSSLTLSGDVNRVPIYQQGPGSLTTALTGTIEADVDLANGTIQFWNAVDGVGAENSGSWQPTSDGSSGAEPANFGGAIAFLGTGQCAIRNAVVGIFSDPLPLYPVDQGGAYGFPSYENFVLNAGMAAYSHPIIGHGTVNLAGYESENQAEDGYLYDVYGNGSLWAFAFPIHVTVTTDVAGLPATLNFDGVIASYGVPDTIKATATTLASSPNPSSVGQNVTFTATVTSPAGGTPSGTVTFYAGGAVLGASGLDGSGRATWDVADLGVGTHSITAVYSGDTTFTGSTSAPLTQTVNKITTAIALNVNPVSVTYGQTVTFTATVTAADGGGVTGTVTFRDGGASWTVGVTGNTASMTIATLPVGHHDITAAYNGDATHDTTTVAAAVGLDVLKAATATTLTSDGSPSFYSEEVTFQARVTTNGPGVPTGTVSFRANAGGGNILLGVADVDANGKATLRYGGFVVGTWQITATYNGDATNDRSTSDPLEHIVVPSPSFTILESNTPTFCGRPVRINGFVTPLFPSLVLGGMVTFFLDGADLGAFPVGSDGGVFVDFPHGLMAGDHVAGAIFSGNHDMLASTATPIILHIDRSTPQIMSLTAAPLNARIGDTVTLKAVVSSGPTMPVPGGTVLFTDGDTVLGTVVLDGAGQAFLSTTFRTAGAHVLRATYSGDPCYLPAQAVTDYIVDKGRTTTTVTSSPNPSKYGQAVTFTATVSPVPPAPGRPTGGVTFRDGAAILGSGTLDAAGHATFTTAALGVGSHNITAFYVGDANFESSTSAVHTHVVVKADTTTAVVTSGSPTVYGQWVTFTATVGVVAPGTGSPGGTVTFKDGSTVLGTASLNLQHKASLDYQWLDAGSHTVTATYNGDPNFNPSSGSVGQAVTKADTTTRVVARPNPSVFGQEVTLIASVFASYPGDGTPHGGTMTFKDGATVLATVPVPAGDATYLTRLLGVGSHVLSATYSGDANFNASGAAVSVTQVVTKADTAVVLRSSVNPSVYGQAVTFTATVNAAGQATLTAANLSVKVHRIGAAYGGSPSFNPSPETKIDQTVNRQGATTTVVSGSPSPSVYGQLVTFTATVRPVPPSTGTPTGTVTFQDGGTTLGTAPLSGGQATYTTRALATGSHAIVAVYAGDVNFTGSTSAPWTQTVRLDGTVTTVASSANPSVYGQAVTFTVQVSAAAPGSGTPTGSVTLMDGAVTLGVAPLNGSGQATLSTTALGVGSHPITASYPGDGNFTPSTSAGLSQTVNKADPVIVVTSSPNPSVYLQAVTFTATVSAVPPGAGIPTGSVFFSDGDDPMASPSLNGGQASFTATGLAVGTHRITARYVGDGNFNPSVSAVLTQYVVDSYGAIHEFWADGPGSQPAGIATGPDGNLWFTEYAANLIVRFTPLGSWTMFLDVPTPRSYPHSITAGPGGSLWFTESAGNKIAEVTTDGRFTFTEYALPTPGSLPWGITTGPDGNVWFVERLGNRIGRITPTGVITEYPIPTPNSLPWGITAGPDGNLWFTEPNANRIGAVTTAGVFVRDILIPLANALPQAITAGPDRLWFTEYNANRVGWVTPDGRSILEYNIPTPNSGPWGITAAPGGDAFWFTEYQGNKLGRVTLAGDVREYPLPGPGRGPVGITVGPDRNLWFCELDAGQLGEFSLAGGTSPSAPGGRGLRGVSPAAGDGDGPVPGPNVPDGAAAHRLGDAVTPSRPSTVGEGQRCDRARPRHRITDGLEDGWVDLLGSEARVS